MLFTVSCLLLQTVHLGMFVLVHVLLSELTIQVSYGCSIAWHDTIHLMAMRRWHQFRCCLATYSV